MDASEVLRALLQKASEWSLPLVVASMDVEQAFDIIRHHDVAVLLWLHQCPAHIRYAWLRQQTNCTGEVSANGATSIPFVRAKALPQGGSASPHIFNAMLHAPFGKIGGVLGGGGEGTRVV